MRRFIAGLCCVIVAAQVLVGFVFLVAAALTWKFGGRLLEPLAVELRVNNHAVAGVPPAPPATDDFPADDPILTARAGRGSLLAGTMLADQLSPADEERAFVAAVRKVAADDHVGSPVPANSLPSAASGPVESQPAAPSIAGVTSVAADQFAVNQLYAMAESDEQAGIYARADQWRGLARTITQEMATAGGNAVLAGESHERPAERH